MVELAGVIFALLIEVLVGVIFAQPLKTTSGEKAIWLGSHGFVTAKKLYCLIGPMYFAVSASTKRPRDIEVAKAKGQRSEGQRGPEFKSGGLRPVGSGHELEDK